MVKTRLPYNEEILIHKFFFSGTYHLDTLHSVTVMTETHIYYKYFKEKKKITITTNYLSPLFSLQLYLAMPPLPMYMAVHTQQYRYVRI